MKGINMIRTAKLFLRCDKNIVNNLRAYYNDNCYQYVKPERKYRIKYNDEWCAMFVSVVAHLNGYRDNFPYEVSVNEQVKIAKANGTFTCDVKKVRQGDLIVFNWNDDFVPDHIGFVDSVGDVIKTVERNKDDTVGVRTLKKTSKYIYGYIKC